MPTQNNYWIERDKKAQEKFTNQSIAATQKQLKKQYRIALQSVITDFEATYDKLLATVGEGKSPTPADLYKLDKYWETQAKLSKILETLGDKSSQSLSRNFQRQYEGIYNIINLPQSASAFSTPDLAKAEQIINSIWCADGQSWSQRVWNNTQMLQQELNDKLVECIVAGKKTSQLKQELMSAFDVSYSRASTLVRTEMAHLQTEAAAARYKDYGIKKVEILAEDAGCDYCNKLNHKKLGVYEKMPIPAHPNCRCCIIPVIDDAEPIQLNLEQKNDIIQKKINKVRSPKAAISPDVQEAIDKVHELQRSNQRLRFYKRTPRHQKHAEELTGLIGDAAWDKYEAMADAFIKKEIDMVDVVGFISAKGNLIKFQYSTGLFAIFSDKGTISTLFIPDKETHGKSPKEYWEQQSHDFRRKPK